MAIVLISTFAVKAQQQVQFKIKLQPNRLYAMKGDIKLDGSVNLSGNPEMLDKLKQQGITQPIQLKIAVQVNGIGKTGAINDEKKFPVVYQLQPFSMTGVINGKNIPIPAVKTGLTIHGFVDDKGIIDIDSLNNQRLADTNARKIALKMMTAIQSKIKFPDKPMKIGDSFTQSVPVNIPVTGNNTEIAISTTYKLVSIQGNIASFDMLQSINVKMDMKQAIIDITGSGSGKLIYDINENYPTTMNGDATIKINFSVGDKLAGNGAIKFSTDVRYTISNP